VGRRGIRPTDDVRWVFNRLAGDYAARPEYPDALVDRLLALAGGPGAAIADLGAGLGHLALPLAARGARVAAVEPARAMLDALAQRAAAAGAPVRALHAAAESTGLDAASADLAVLADVLQWVDPDAAGRELARVVRPGGAVAVVEARLLDTPFLRELGALLSTANFKARPAAADARERSLAAGEAAPAPAPRLAQLLAGAGVRGAARETFRHEERLAPERLEAVLRSLSYVGPALGPAARDATLARARALAETHGGAVWAREVTLTWGRSVA
jgi:ubiquinone/menaquinone biosynthesis C-methylase UbiE